MPASAARSSCTGRGPGTGAPARRPRRPRRRPDLASPPSGAELGRDLRRPGQLARPRRLARRERRGRPAGRRGGPRRRRLARPRNRRGLRADRRRRRVLAARRRLGGRRRLVPERREVRRAGALWAGTVGVNEAGLAAEGAGALYCLELDGRVRRVLEGVSLSNGMDWSPDGGTFYYVDSRSGGIDAFAFDLSSGELRDPRRVVELGFPPEVGFVDGLCVDTDGGIWAAVWGFGEVRRYSPAGALDRTMRLPVAQPTSCVFAGRRARRPRDHVGAPRPAPRGARAPAACGQRVLLPPGCGGLPPHPCRVGSERERATVSARPSPENVLRLRRGLYCC